MVLAPALHKWSWHRNRQQKNKSDYFNGLLTGPVMSSAKISCRQICTRLTLFLQPIKFNYTRNSILGISSLNTYWYLRAVRTQVAWIMASNHKCYICHVIKSASKMTQWLWHSGQAACFKTPTKYLQTHHGQQGSHLVK